jgi:hypothetical protein
MQARLFEIVGALQSQNGNAVCVRPRRFRAAHSPRRLARAINRLRSFCRIEFRFPRRAFGEERGIPPNSKNLYVAEPEPAACPRGSGKNAGVLDRFVYFSTIL